jgi:hypothetical protein
VGAVNPWNAARLHDGAPPVSAPTPTLRYFCGLDLGQAQDYSAWSVVEQCTREGEPARYTVRDLRRWPLRTAYPAIVADTLAWMDRPPLTQDGQLIVDGTGVGAAVTDLLQVPALSGRMTKVLITAGTGATRDETTWSTWHVAKTELVSVVQVLLQSRRLEVIRALSEARTLTRELADFQMRFTAAANVTFNAREGAHDDLVLSVALACWWAEQQRPAPLVAPGGASELSRWRGGLDSYGRGGGGFGNGWQPR